MIIFFSNLHLNIMCSYIKCTPEKITSSGDLCNLGNRRRLKGTMCVMLTGFLPDATLFQISCIYLKNSSGTLHASIQ